MSALESLPNRRIEGWRWSDLRAAMAQRAGLRVAPGDDHPILRLARGANTIESSCVPAGAQESLLDAVGSDLRTDLSARIVEVGDGATLSRVLMDYGPADRTVTNLLQASLGAGATCRLFVMSEGAKYARLETDIRIAGAGARVELSGIYLVGQGRHADLTSLVQIEAPGAEVNQIVRGAARKGGRGVFQGKFKLERAAQKANAEMQHNALLLQEGAEVFAKPELEIYADDVQCAHGNTAGQMDEMAVFYLRSRGIPETQARAMITRAFLVAALPDWLPDAVRLEAETRIDRWLEGAA